MLRVLIEESAALAALALFISALMVWGVMLGILQ